MNTNVMFSSATDLWATPQASSTNSMRSFILLLTPARVRIMRSARSFTQNTMMGYCRIGPVKLFFVTRLMEGVFVTG